MSSSKTKNYFKRSIKVIVFVLMFVLIHEAVSELITPRIIVPRTTILGMYAQKGNIDIAFVGNSKVYRSCNPKIFDKKLGVNSYNLGTGVQTWDQSYYLVKELLGSHKPKTILIAAGIGRFVPDASEKRRLVVLDFMRLSANKVAYMLDSVPKEEYLIALSRAYRFRESFNIKTILSNIDKKNNVKGYWDESSLFADETTYKGFRYYKKILSDENIGTDKVISALKKDQNRWYSEKMDYDSIEYFYKTVELCRENGIDIILIDVPIPYAIVLSRNYNEYSNYIREIAELSNVMLWDFNALKPDLFDCKLDCFSDFTHMNEKGAEQFSLLLAGMLQSYYDGSFDYNSYFYSSYKEWCDNFDEIANVLLEVKFSKKKKEVTLTAKSICGENLTPMYQFVYRKSNEKEYTIIQDYSENPVAVFKPKKDVDYIVSVNVRSKEKPDSSMHYSSTFIYD